MQSGGGGQDSNGELLWPSGPASITANTAPLRIVAIGASNTHGWYVGNQGAYPAQLQALLQARGIDAQVTNAGVPFDMTWMMLRRIDTDVPNGTDIVIVQPGTNDLRFFGTMQQRAANITEMARRFRARSIKVIVYDEKVPLRYYTLDFIHPPRETMRLESLIGATDQPELRGQSHALQQSPP